MRGLVVAAGAQAGGEEGEARALPAPYAILELWQKYDGDRSPRPDPSCSIESLITHPTARI